MAALLAPRSAGADGACGVPPLRTSICRSRVIFDTPLRHLARALVVLRPRCGGSPFPGVHQEPLVGPLQAGG